MMLLADSSTGIPTSVSPLSYLQYGVLGLVIVALLLGYLWTKPAVERLILDKERAEAQRDALVEAWQTQILPVLQKSTDTMSAMTEVMQDAIAALREEDAPRRPNRPHGR
jgi:hypothetical protein